MESKNLLVEFLKKEGIFDKFKENFDPEFVADWLGKKYTFDEYIEKFSNDHWGINLAFFWGDSVDKHGYWNDIQSKFEDFLESVNDNKLQSAITTLETYNSWRRGAEIEQPNPTEIGEAIDIVLTELKSRL
jgi:hypothetical protein